MGTDLRPNLDIDRVGAAASLACAVHCAAIPLLLALGAAGAIPWLDHGAVEWCFVGTAAFLGGFAAWRGYRVHRRALAAAALVGSALALVVVMATQHDDHAHEGEFKWIFPILGLAVAAAHLWNRRLVHRAQGCTAHDHG